MFDLENAIVAFFQYFSSEDVKNISLFATTEKKSISDREIRVKLYIPNTYLQFE